MGATKKGNREKLEKQELNGSPKKRARSPFIRF